MPNFSVGSQFNYQDIPYRVIQRESFNMIKAESIDTGLTRVFEKNKILSCMGNELTFPEGKTFRKNRETIVIPEITDPEALRKYGIIKPILRRSSEAKVKEIARANNVSVPTIYNWRSAYKKKQLVGLVNAFNERGRKRYLNKKVEQIMLRVIENVYPTSLCPSYYETWRAVVEECYRVNPKFIPPSYNTVVNRIKERNERQDYQKRKGQKKFEDKYLPTPGEYPTTRPLEIVEIDHHELDVFAVDESRKIVMGRPWLTIVIDTYSRAIVGFYLTLCKPSYVSLMMAVYNTLWIKDETCKKHGIDPAEWNVFGIPEIVSTDNGKDFLSKDFDSARAYFNIDMQNRRTYTARDGGKIERYFKTLINRLVSRLQGRTFSNPQERGAYPSSKEAIYTLNEIERFICKYIVRYMNTYHKGIKTTPKRKWEEGFRFFEPNIPDSIEELKLFLLKEETRIINRDAVFFHTIAYKHPLINHEDMIGKETTVRFDPRCLSKVHVKVPGTQDYILCEAAKKDQNKARYSIGEIPKINKYEKAQGMAAESAGLVQMDIALSDDVAETAKKGLLIKNGDLKVVAEVVEPVPVPVLVSSKIQEVVEPTSNYVSLEQVPLFN
jgi:putative transposase